MTPRPSGPEIFVGFVCATGTNLNLVLEVMDEELKEFGYESHHTRLVELLHGFSKWENLPERPLDSRLSSHMDAGNEFRSELRSGAALALLAIGDIFDKRVAVTGHSTSPIPRCAYCLRSLKHPDEVDAFQEIYKDAFMLVGVYSPYDDRLEYLTQRIAESHNDFNVDSYRERAEHLIQRDQEEADNPVGQNVRRTFHRADVFLDASDPMQLRSSVRRFVELLFGASFHTPSQDEFGMFHAQAAALRSADLSRQVGAAIATPNGDIVAVGTNDVPRAGGGLR